MVFKKIFFTLFLFLLVFLCAQSRVAPPKFKKVGNVIYNMTADSVGFTFGNDTSWFAATGIQFKITNTTDGSAFDLDTGVYVLMDSGGSADSAYAFAYGFGGSAFNNTEDAGFHHIFSQTDGAYYGIFITTNDSLTPFGQPILLGSNTKKYGGTLMKINDAGYGNGLHISKVASDTAAGVLLRIEDAAGATGLYTLQDSTGTALLIRVREKPSEGGKGLVLGSSSDSTNAILIDFVKGQFNTGTIGTDVILNWQGGTDGQVLTYQVDGTTQFENSVAGSTDSFYVAEAASTTTGWKQSGDTIFVDTASGTDSSFVAQYAHVSDSLALALLKTGGTMSGDIAMGNGEITGADKVTSDTITSTTWLYVTATDSLVIEGPGSKTVVSDSLYADTIVTNGDVITDFTGTNLSVSGGVLNATGSTDSFYVAEAASTTTGWKQSGDTIFVDTTGGSGGSGVWADTTGNPDSVYFVDIDNDTGMVISDNDAGQVEWDIGPDQSYLKIGAKVDSVQIGPIGLTEADSLRISGSFYLPHDVNPTIDVLGEIAQDANDIGLTIYDTVYDTSIFISAIQSIQVPILSTANDTMLLYHFKSLQFPGGVEIIQIALANYTTTTDTVVLYEWSDEIGTAVSRIDTLILGAGTYTEISKGSIEDTDIATGAWIVGTLMAANAPSLHLTVYYYAKPTN